MLRWIVCFGLIFVCANLATAQEKTLKIVTWNIEYGKNYEEILAGLHTLDADVYLLQEVSVFFYVWKILKNLEVRYKSLLLTANNQSK